MESFILYLLILIIPLIAQLNINSTYAMYKGIKNKKKLSGFEVARKILDENGLTDMYIVEVRGNLTDHYEPTQKVVRLSSDVFHGETIAAAAVASHECGHAIQDKKGYSWFRIRSALCPVVNFITYVAYILFLLSLVLQLADMLILSIVMVLAGLVFQLVTLPVEFDASKRAIEQMNKLVLLDKTEVEGTKKVLKAAALTYVASVLSSILNLLRLIIIYNDENRNR